MKDIQQEITNKIIEQLEKGVNPWACPWDRSTDGALPYNHKTGSAYKGMNIFMLWLTAKDKGYSRNSWLTFKQAQAMGGKVCKGEKSTMGIFYKQVEKKGTKDLAVNEKEFYPMAKAFNVFNVEQIDGLELEPLFEPKEFNPILNAETLIKKTGATIHHSGTRAFYRSSDDFIQMPDKERFNDSANYYTTLTHELTHWTAHQTRCDRNLKNEFGTEEYAFEELIAEMGSAFINAELGLIGEIDHVSYIESWLKALKNDKRFIFKAASQASKAYEFIFSLAQNKKEAA